MNSAPLFHNDVQCSVVASYSQSKKTQPGSGANVRRVQCSSGGCKGVVATEVLHSDLDKQTEEWVTEDQLGGPKYLNNKQHAAWYVQDRRQRGHGLFLCDVSGHKRRYKPSPRAKSKCSWAGQR